MTRDSSLLAEVGVRVRALRRARKLTARAAAAAAGVSLRLFSDLEAGRANVALSRLAAVAAALGVPPAALLQDEGPTPAAEPPAGVALLGLRGAGKSTVGPLVAARIGAAFVELDERIEEAAGLSLSEIFALHGEAYHRRLAARCLAALAGGDTIVVVALPGGIVHEPAAFDLARRRFVTVWLKARPEQHLDRVREQGDPRPMAGRPDAMAELREILASRSPLYATADVTIDTSRRLPAAVATAAVTAVAARLQVAGAPASPRRRGRAAQP